MKKIYDLFRKMPLLTGIVGVALLTVATRGIDTGRTIGFAGMMLRGNRVPVTFASKVTGTRKVIFGIHIQMMPGLSSGQSLFLRRF